MKENRRSLCKNISLTLLLILLILILIRQYSPAQLEDVRPGRYCSENYIQKSEYLMVIPLFENNSIADNKTWCEQILALNKTLGMHGVTHSQNEFAVVLDQEYIIKGMEEFKKCFGYYPEIFSAPQFKLNKSNKRIFYSLDMEIHGWLFAITHKVYHCVDNEKKSYLEKVNRIMWIISLA